MSVIKLATRRSSLALAQSTWVAERISSATGATVELVPVVSEGDRNLAPLTQIGGVGVFVAAVREAVRDGSADLAVHSLKDLPTAAAAGLRLAGVPERADPRDAVISLNGGLEQLAPGSRVGTGSPRRRAQLQTLRPDLEVLDLRGNVDARIDRVDRGELSAVILALAGLQRLGRADRATQILQPEQMLPAPGQGALAIETRADAAPQLLDLLTQAELEHAPTRAAVTAERALLATLEAGCTAPVGALARITCADLSAPDSLSLTAVVCGPGSRVSATVSGSADHASAVGVAAAQELLATGADQLMEMSLR